MHIRLRTKTFKSDVNEIIGHINERIQSEITSMDGKELESINVTSTCDKE